MVKYGCCLSLYSFGPRPSGGSADIKQAAMCFKDGVLKLLGNGFDYIELNTGSIVNISEDDYAIVSEAIRACGIKVPTFNCFIPSTLKLVGDNVDYGEIEKYIEKAMERIKGVGGKCIVFGSGASRKVPDNFSMEKAEEQIIVFLNICEKYGSYNGLTVAIEPLNRMETNMINTVSEAFRISEKVDLPHVGVLADSYHMYMENENTEILKKVKEKIFHIHISDKNRSYPGKISDGMDFKKLFGILKEINYDKTISLECGFDDIEKESLLSIKYIKNLWKIA
ncbi:MAG: sugar phosphate isomerase/epimerase family protein [Clostridiales bacterium]|nr:sugar phosphate isomerase/epimerase family protein [Clostridiales bacterium]